MRNFILIYALLSANLFAASASNRLWMAVNSFNELSESLQFQLFAEQRYNTDLGETAQSVFLFGPHYRLNPNHRFGLLYGDFHSPNVVEHRFVLEHFQNWGKFSRFNFVTRARLEGRYLENSSDDSTRLRYFISILEKSDRPYNLFIWTEPFINLTDEAWTGNRTIERVRSFIGTRIKVAKVNLDVGYMNESIPRSSGDRVEHILSLTLQL